MVSLRRVSGAICVRAQVEALELDADVRDIVDRHLGNMEKRNY